MHEDIDLLAELYPRCFCRTNRRPLMIGVCEEVISQHPEMSRHRIKRLLRKYTQSPKYGFNVAGQVTAADEEDAKRKIAKEARRAAAEAIEDRKVAGEPAAKPVAERPGQQNPIPEAKSEQSAPAGPPRLGFTGSPGQARRREVIQGWPLDQSTWARSR